MDAKQMMDYAEQYKASQTPLVDLLRRVHPEATAEITEPSGWSYHTVGLGRTLHEAAGLIEKLQEELQQPAPNPVITASQVLSRDERDALVETFTLLGLLKDIYHGSATDTGYRVGEVRKRIYAMLHGDPESREK